MRCAGIVLWRATGTLVSPRSTLRPTIKRGGRLGRVSWLVDASRVITAQENARPIPMGDAGLNRLFNLRLRSMRCRRSRRQVFNGW
jgi:hypothetical protein